MNTDLKTDIKIYSIMVKKPFLNMRPGAYAGARFEAKPIGQLYDEKIESPYLNINTNIKSR